MQNQEHSTQAPTDAVPTVPTAPCVTPPKKHELPTSFFGKMYSRRGTLTCKEFKWSAIYLIILGRKFLMLSLLPAYYVVLGLPKTQAGLLWLIFFLFYGIAMFILLFLYPLFNVCTKVLHAAKVPQKYIATAVIMYMISVDILTMYLGNTILSKTILPYFLYIILALICYHLGKYFKKINGYSTE